LILAIGTDRRVEDNKGTRVLLFALWKLQIKTMALRYQAALKMHLPFEYQVFLI